MRNIELATGEFYHIFNHGVEDRFITADNHDSDRFVQSMLAFNNKESIGSIYELSQSNKESLKKTSGKPLVNIIAYCLNPNHFHLILEQVDKNGISLFMKRLCGGYSYYFNNMHKRKGTLFRGPYKAKHIPDNDYILHLSSYVNLNDRVHQFGYQVTKLVRSSIDEYLNKKPTSSLCKKSIILDQFKNLADYKKFCEDSLLLMLERKEQEKDLRHLMME